MVAAESRQEQRQEVASREKIQNVMQCIYYQGRFSEVVPYQIGSLRIMFDQS